MKKVLKYLSINFLALTVMSIPLVSVAGGVIQPGDVDPTEPGWTLVPPECTGPDAADVVDGVPVCGFPEFMQLIANAMSLLMVLALFVSTLLFSVAGFRYVTAAGNTSQVEGAKKMLFNVAIGLAIVFGAYLLVQVVVSTLGVQDDYNQFIESMD